MTDPVYLVDTNILVYAYDTSDLFKHEVSSELFEEFFSGKKKFSICLQNLTEFFKVATEKMQNKMSNEEATLLITDLISLSSLKKIHYRESTLLKSLEIERMFRIHFWDALIAATMIENGIFHIYTENVKDFNKIPGIITVNPFE